MSGTRFPHLPAEAWELYLRDELSGSSLESLEAHLDGCGPCRAALEAADPSRLFRRLRGIPVREEALAGLWDSVRAEIESAPATSRPPARRDRFALLAGVASLVLAIVLLQAARPDGRGSETAVFSPEPCTRLALSSDECRDLFQDVRFDSEPTLVVAASGDLSELL